MYWSKGAGERAIQLLERKQSNCCKGSVANKIIVNNFLSLLIKTWLLRDFQFANDFVQVKYK